MELRITRRKPTPQAVQSPNITGAKSSNNSNSNSNGGNGLGGISSSSNISSRAQVTLSNSGANESQCAKLQPQSVVRVDSLFKAPIVAPRMASGSHICRRPSSHQRRLISPTPVHRAVVNPKTEFIEHRVHPSPAPSRPPHVVKHRLAALSPAAVSSPHALQSRGTSAGVAVMRRVFSISRVKEGIKPSTLLREPQEVRTPIHTVTTTAERPRSPLSDGGGGGGEEEERGSFASIGGRRNVVLDAKQPTLRPKMVHDEGSGTLPPLGKCTRGEVVCRYKKLCKEFGEYPQSAWISAVLGNDTKPSAYARTESNVAPLPALKALTNGGKIHVASGSNGIGVNRSCNTSHITKRGLSVSTRQNLKMFSTVEIKRSNSAFVRATSINTPLEKRLSFTKSVRGSKGVGDVAFEHLVAYCQHLLKYRQNMENLQERRRYARQALERFLEVCQYTKQVILNPSRSSILTTLESQAEVLTKGLREIQQRNAALVLCLAEYSQEARRPLGLSHHAHTPVIVVQQKEQQVPKPKESKLKLSGLVCPSMGTKLNPKPSNSPLSPNGGASSRTPLNFCLPSEPPTCYHNFLRDEERRIVQELMNGCEKVRETLKKKGVVIADEFILATPLFISSSMNPNTPGEGEKQMQLSINKDEPTRLNAAGGSLACSTLHTPSECPTHCRLYAPQSNSSVKSTEKHRGKGRKKSIRKNENFRHFSRAALERDELNNCLPLFGVPLTGWSVAGDEENGFRRHGTSTPQLVLGSAGKVLSLVPPSVTKHRGVHASHNSAGQRNANAERESAVKQRSSTMPNRKPGPKMMSFSSHSSTIKGGFSAEQLKKAVEIWETMKGIIATTEGESLKDENGAGFIKVMVNSSPSLFLTSMKSRVVMNEEFEGKVRNPSSQLDISVADSTDEIMTVNRLESLPDHSLEQLGKTDVKSSPREQAVAVIIRFLQRCVARKPCLSVNTEQSSIIKEPSAEKVHEFKEVTKDSAAMATRIACCWRQYIARNRMLQRLLQVKEEKKNRQQWHYKTLMAYRIQRFFKILLVRRRQHEARQQSYTGNPESNDCTKCMFSGSKISYRETDEIQLTVQERFERAKEKRKLLLQAFADSFNPKSCSKGLKPSSIPSLKNGSTNVKQTIQPPQRECVSVPPLSLRRKRISNHCPENYNPEAESIEVQVLHRLLNAPKAVLFVTRVLCDACPTTPVSALNFLAASTKEAKDERNGSVDTESHKQEGQEHQHEYPVTSTNCSFVVNQEHHTSGLELHLSLPPPPTPLQEQQQQQQQQRQKSEPEWEIHSNRCFYRRLKENSAIMKGTITSIPYPPSFRVESFIEDNEITATVPVCKAFQRPFEHWGTAYAFQRRVFSAAAEYAWRLVFSHTPHDDYKQSMLKTREEQESRLERVEQRNRMILACYCVSSEQEWLKEASRDLGFVARIWNPKKSFDPNDPEFKRHCRETYEFVEDFLYQCFPTVMSLDDVPTFLMGAGVFFLLKSSLAKSEKNAIAHSLIDEEMTQRNNHPRLPDATTPLTSQQHSDIFTYELLELLENLCLWSCSSQSGKTNGSENLGTTVVNGSEKRIEESDRDNGAGEHPNTSEGMHNPKSHGLANVTKSGPTFSNSMGRETSDVGGSCAPNTCYPHVQLIVVPYSPTCVTTKGSTPILKIKKKMPNRVKCGIHVGLVFPKGYILGLSERLACVLFGLKLDLEICEDLSSTV